MNVHHCKIKFKDIFYLCCKQVGIKPSELIYQSEAYYKVKDLVIQYHECNSDLGIVVCEDCHENIDKCFKNKKEVCNENIKNKEANL